MNFDLVLAGVGGQGVLTIAWVLDHAGHRAGWHLKQSEVHGMAQRGGAVSAFVRMSSQPVASDLIAAGTASLIVAVEPLEALRYTGLLRPDGAVVTDITPMVNIDNYPEFGALCQVLFAVPNLVAVDATRRFASNESKHHPVAVVDYSFVLGFCHYPLCEIRDPAFGIREQENCFNRSRVPRPVSRI